MKNAVALGAVGIALAALLQVPAATPATAQTADQALRVEAQANRARMKAPPTFIDGPHAVLPDAEKAQGHHGQVVIDGVIAPDGRMHAARVKTSSELPTLDAIALAAAEHSRFAPAKDAAGAPLAVLISMPFDLVAYKSAKGGVFEYRCDQFVRDMEWWHGAHPQKAYSEHELYRMELGVQMLSLIQAARGDQDRLRKAIAAFDGKWIAAIEACRKTPTKLQKDALFS